MVVWAVVPVRAEMGGELLARYRRLNESYRVELGAAAPKLPASGGLYFVAPDEYSVRIGVGAKENEAKQDAGQSARDRYAAALFELAKEAAAGGEVSRAFQWATEAVWANPNHADARRVLGYEERDGQWLSAYGVRMHDGGKAWVGGVGWVAEGERNTSAPDATAALGAADAARHADMKHGWQVRTDHFLVTTNHSQAAGAELAARLERLYQVWRQLFAGFFYTEREVQALFAGDRNARVQSRPFRVCYYRTREEYVAALQRKQPRIGETLGIYFDTLREAHFFAGEGESTPTLYHEAIHQLFQETKPAARRIGANGNFWVVEGVATYFESFTEHEERGVGLYYTLGEGTAGRLPAARERLSEGFHVPLDELTKMSQGDVQQYPEIAKLYGQCAAVAAFLVDGEEGRYREPLVRTLQAVYGGKDEASTLADSTGRSYRELDAAYRQFLKSLP